MILRWILVTCKSGFLPRFPQIKANISLEVPYEQYCISFQGTSLKISNKYPCLYMLDALSQIYILIILVSISICSLINQITWALSCKNSCSFNSNISLIFRRIACNLLVPRPPPISRSLSTHLPMFLLVS